MQDNKNVSSSTPKPAAHVNSQGQILLDITLPGDQLKLETKPFAKGAFGEVYVGKWGNRVVAVKKLLQTSLTESEKETFMKEASALFPVSASSENVVRLFKITIQPYYSLVMELMPKGNLFDLLQNNRNTPLLWEVRYRLAMDISTGLSDIHSHNILHCDLKSLNVLLDDRLRAKLADFGLASIKKNNNNYLSRSGGRGTVQWTAPEVLFGGKNTDASDVYSLGMIFWELVTHRVPFADIADQADEQPTFRETIPENCPKDFRALILDCWSAASKRPKALQVVDRLQPLLESNVSDGMPAVQTTSSSHAILLPSIPSIHFKPSPDYQSAPGAPIRSTVPQQPLVTTPRNQPESPAPPKPVEEKTPGLTAFQTGYQLYHQGQYLQVLPHLRQAAKAGYAPAYIDLGVMYELGLGVDKEVDEATIWYKKAQRSESWFEQQADSEEAMSEFYLGRYYQFAAGSKKDGLEASGRYRRAAKQGHAEAQCSLGDCYANGVGVSKDLTQAKQWYEKAAAQGNVHAKTQLVVLQRPSTSPPPPPVVSQTTPSTNTPSSFFAARSSSKPHNKVEAQQSANDPPPGVPKPIPEKSAAPVVVDEKALGQLLKCVAEGEQDQAEALIKKDSKLLLAAGKVTDLSGRTFDNITAFQYALWAMDYHMWTMIQKHLPAEVQAKQHALLESKGTAHGKHFDLQPLLDALQVYVDNVAKWNYDQRAEDQWCKKVGGAQKLLPAHVVNEYCRSDRPFNPCPSEWTSPVLRTRAVEIYDGSKWVKGVWFTPPNSSKALGVSFAFCRGCGGGAQSAAGGGGGAWDCAADLKSLQALWNARTHQLKLVSDTLVVGSQSTIQVGLK